MRRALHGGGLCALWIRVLLCLGCLLGSRPAICNGEESVVCSTALLHSCFISADNSVIGVGQLPAEARQTLTLIDRGGPFPYRRDGIVFNNYERLLPAAPRGYYHEYTVPTPGRRDRGARRIVTGGNPPTVFYYTGDHYRSFQRIQQ